CQLDFAYNGKAGIEKALDTVPDLIVSDVMMPIMDGFEVLAKLKEDERTSHIPIILLTAKADVQSRLAGLRRGADAYLSKPFNREELLVTVDNLLRLRLKLQKHYSKLLSEAPAAVARPASSDPENLFLQKIRSLVEENLSDSNFEIVHLERALAMSRSQIYRKVKALTGKSPSAFIRSIRLHRGRHLLLTSDLSISEIAYDVGYAALNSFSDAFLEEFGERPMKFRDDASGQ
ncbi:MAG: helix-turn-helix domain-containing protein, partial [Bacteroidetes bacterium]